MALSSKGDTVCGRMGVTMPPARRPSAGASRAGEGLLGGKPSPAALVFPFRRRQGLPAQPAQQLEQVAEVHAAVTVVVKIPQVARIAGTLAQATEEAVQVVQAHMAIAIRIAEQAEEGIDGVAAR